jgi:flagellar biosynthesis protein FlhG
VRAIGEQTHYEVLEVSPQATQNELERAYRVARAAYAEGSLAHYSVFDGLEAAAILERVEQAWGVLSDPGARAAYDAALDRHGAADEPRSAPRRPPPAPPRLDVIEEVGDPEDDAEFDGASLRRMRLRRGIDLEQIAQVTKVNPRYLRCIEEESFEDLPAAVYVRGFVTAYARAIRLDAGQVAARYMERFFAARDGGRRPRLLGRR